MGERTRCLVLDVRDNVATALTELAPEEAVRVRAPDGAEQVVVVRQPIPLGHKFALRAIPKGEPIVKHGLPIGLATQEITPGEHVHVHNVTGEGLDGR